MMDVEAVWILATLAGGVTAIGSLLYALAIHHEHRQDRRRRYMNKRQRAEDDEDRHEMSVW